MASHTLPTFETPLGVFTVQIETDVLGLTTPTENTIIDLRGGNESLELIPGTLNRSTSQIRVIDTPDQFWANVCTGETLILVLLNEGSGNTFAFGGDISQVSTRADELWNDGSQARRTLNVSLQSPLLRLKNTTVTAVVEQVKVNAEIAPATATGMYAPVLSVFAAAIESAMSQSYLAGDAYLQSGTEDFQYNDGTSDLDFDEIYFQTQDAVDYVGYMKASDPKYWGERHQNAWELINNLALNFGLIPRYDYNPDTGRHRMQLLQRGRCFASDVSLPAASKSSFVYDSYMILNKVSVLWPQDGSLGWYWNYGPITAAPVPDWLDAELEIVCDFVVGYDIFTYPTVSYERLYSFATGDPVQIASVKVWNYGTASQDNINSGVARLEKSLVTYFVNRYSGSGQVTYQRTFPLMRDTGSHTEVQPMCEVDVDGDTYTAIECDKDWTTGGCSLTLVKL